MNLNENLDRIKQVMGIITESKSIKKLIDELGIDDTIKFVGGGSAFENMGGGDYEFSNKENRLFKMGEEVLKDYTNLIIMDDIDYEHEEDYDNYVVYGEGHKGYKIKPGFIYFDWDKYEDKLSVDEALSDKLKPLGLSDDVIKYILKRWVRKYYNIYPIDQVRFGSELGYNDEG